MGSIGLACSDYSWPDLSHGAVLDLIADLGFRAVSLGFFTGHTPVTPEDIAPRPDYWAGVLHERLRSRGLAVADVFGSGATGFDYAVNSNDPSQAERARHLFQDLVTVALGLGATGITMLPGVVFEGEPADAGFRRSVATLREFVDRAGDAGLRFSVEPHIGSIIDTPAKTGELLSHVPGLELTLDYGHFHCAGIEDRVVDSLLASTRHFHLRGGTLGKIQTSYDDNTIDFERIVKEMQRIDWHGWIEVEYVHHVALRGGDDCDNTQQVAAYKKMLDPLVSGSQ